jgi:hypothetical protein
VECEQANLVGIVTDEGEDSGEIDGRIEVLARQLSACAMSGYISPPTFLGIGGQKIFRDEIWASLRVVFRADHRYYRRHGLYDFPKRTLKRRATDALLSLLLKIPSFRREYRKRIKEEMVKPLQKVVEQAPPRD